MHGKRQMNSRGVFAVADIPASHGLDKSGLEPKGPLRHPAENPYWRKRCAWA